MEELLRGIFYYVTDETSRDTEEKMLPQYRKGLVGFEPTTS